MRRCNKPRETHNYGPLKSNFEVDYYKKTHFSTKTICSYQNKTEKKKVEKSCIILKVSILTTRSVLVTNNVKN